MPLKPAVDEAVGGRPTIEHVLIVRRLGDAAPDTRSSRAATSGGTTSSSARTRLPARSRSTSEHMLYLLYTSGSTAKPKGITHTTAGYLVGTSYTHQMIFDIKPDDVYWCAADIGWVTGHSYIVYGPLANATTGRPVRRLAGHAGLGSLVADHRGLQGLDPVLRADRDPGVHEAGRRPPGEARPVVAPRPRLGRRADQPRGLALVPRAHRRRQGPDRRHVVADRDRPDPHHAAARRDDDEARLRDVPVPGRSRPTSSTARASPCRSAAAATSS